MTEVSDENLNMSMSSDKAWQQVKVTKANGERMLSSASSRKRIGNMEKKDFQMKINLNKFGNP